MIIKSNFLILNKKKITIVEKYFIQITNITFILITFVFKIVTEK